MRILFAGICFLVTLYSTAQVRDVRSNIEKDKSENPAVPISYQESHTTSYSPPDLSDGFAAFIFESLFYYTAYGAYRGLRHGQSLMQERRYNHPETFSLEGNLITSFDFRNNAVMLSPSVRGNWGLFATDIRFNYTMDVTGDLHALDWQVLKLRLPLGNVTFDYGIGFSHVFSPSKTYFDQATGFDWYFLNRKATIQGQYQWSQRTSLGSRYRQESRIKACYEVASSGRFRFSPSVGFEFQDYFGTTQFRFVQIGLTVRLY